LKGENDKLKGEVADLAQPAERHQGSDRGLLKPLSAQETTGIARTLPRRQVSRPWKRRSGAIESSHCSAEYRADVRRWRTGDFVHRLRQFFSPFGGDGTRAVQAQGEYSYYSGRQEGQFDIGLVNRWGNVQAGAFGSFKYLNSSPIKAAAVSCRALP
jgi:hypothetical protein